MSNQTHVLDEDLRTMLVCSFRYSLGRMTAMPSLVQDLVRKHINVMRAWDLEQMATDIERSSSLGIGLGMECDVVEWQKFAVWCREQANQKNG